MPVKVSEVKKDGYYYVEKDKRVRWVLGIAKERKGKAKAKRIVRFRTRNQNAARGYTVQVYTKEIGEFAQTVDRVVSKDYDPDFGAHSDK